MQTFKKILIPTDFSEASVASYKHAQQIATHCEAQVDFIHIIPTLSYFSESFSRLGAPMDMESDVYPHAQKDATQKLNSLMHEHIAEPNRGEVAVEIHGKASKAIAEYASKHGYDLIVMASRGKDGSDLLRGSTAQKVIRLSKVPVFTVDDENSSGQLKRILIPTDVSALSLSCMPSALLLARAYSADLILFHIRELHGSASEDIEQKQNSTEEETIYNEILKMLHAQVENWKPGWDITIKRGENPFNDKLIVTDNGVSISLSLKTVIKKAVSAHHGIAEYASDHADAVVMATHGHSGLAHFFLGSTTEQVAQHLRMPVVTVKPDKDKMQS